MLQRPAQAQFNDMERRMNALLDEALEPITDRITTLERPSPDSVVYNSSPNYLPNSAPEFSTLAYGTVGTTPTTAGDTNRESYNWYRNTFVEVTDLVTTATSTTATSVSNPFTAARITGTVNFLILGGGTDGATLTGTLTRVSDSQVTLSVAAGATLTAGTMFFGDDLAATAAFALKRSGTPLAIAQHSLWAANEAVNSDIPTWDGVQGNFLLGSQATNYAVSCPLPTDFVYPGQTYYVSFEASLAASDTDIGSSQQFYCGFWDNSSGQKKWLEGTGFTPTASVYGVAGTRTISYKILARTDSNTEILSTEVVVTTAPATMSESNHVRLSFTGAPGFIYYGIYRKDGTAYRKVGEIRNSIDLQFFDMQESSGSPESGFPTITTATPKAYAITSEFAPGDLSSTQFTLHTMTIVVPSTYNRGLTTNAQQWFRFGLADLISAGNEREIVIRRIMVSEGYGTWTRSPRDMQAASSPTSSAASAPPSGDPTGDPGGGGTGGPACVILDTLIETVEPDGTVKRIPIGDVTTDTYTICGASALKVRKIIDGEVQNVIDFVTDNGLRLTCTESHRLVTSVFDKTGRSARLIQQGDQVLTLDGEFKLARIVSKVIVPGQKRVRAIKLDKPHLFITNGFVSHNLKL
jgi:hypothetical protein